MLALTKKTFFTDVAGNAYRKATASEAASDDSAVRASVNDKAGFYLPVTFAELTTPAETADSDE